MEQEGTVEETAPMLKFSDAELLGTISPDDVMRRERLTDALKRIPKPPPLPVTMALQNKGGPAPKTFVLARGDYNNPGEEVEPGFPVILNTRRMSDISIAGKDERTAMRGPRTILADWIAASANPLTARVMVNRIWQHHFGRGLVATPSDFGTRGSRPTHPELLDWLAGEFIARGWSVKAMHRLILMSAAYQQSSSASSDSLARDPENKYCSRQNRLRLEGEAIRDSLLAISGRLNRQMSGPGVSPPISADIIKTSKNWTASADAADQTRRSLYILARRNLRFPFLEVFDAPDSNLSCPERGRSTTAPQSLTLLNSDEVMEAARAMAQRLIKEAKSTDARVALAFRLTLGRPPTAREQTMTQDFLNACSSRRQTARSEIAMADWIELCRTLFNLNAFVYVD